MLLALAFSGVRADPKTALHIPGVEDPWFVDAYALGLEQLARNWEQAAHAGRGGFLGEPVSAERQRDNAARARFFMRANELDCTAEQVFFFGTQHRSGEILPPGWRGSDYRLFCRHRPELLYYWGLSMIADGLKLPGPTLAGLARADAIRSSYRFERAVREYDPGLRDTEMLQATRNFAVAIGLQYTFRFAHELHDAVVAYSLLYPYVDNVLDDAGLDAAGKKRFAGKLFARLNGQTTVDDSPLESKVFDMVERIYNQYPPAEYPRVRQSLLTIFHGQILSLSQQGPALSLSQIESISQFKGAASVLVGAHLVDPGLDEQGFDFAMAFGYLLQLVDDAEDMTEDRRVGQRTQFSALPKHGDDVELLCERLYGYADRVLQLLDRWPHADTAALKLAMRGAIRLMLLRAIARQRSQFSTAYLHDVEKFSPYRLRDLARFDPEANLARFGRSVALEDIEAVLAGTPPQALQSAARRLGRHLP